MYQTFVCQSYGQSSVRRKYTEHDRRHKQIDTLILQRNMTENFHQLDHEARENFQLNDIRRRKNHREHFIFNSLQTQKRYDR